MRLPLAAAIIAAAIPIAAGAATPPPGSLVKIACTASSDVNDPCRAVYYYGGDGRRHAFPHEKVYFTWYPDFSAVQTVSAPFMASLPLGKNVTPRPGVRLVKFLTDPRTYAVALGGTLRWVAGEPAATSLYGADWNAKVDDLSDASFGDYRFGPDITGPSDFGRAGETAAAPTIDDDLPSTHRSLTVHTGGGSFKIELVKLQKDRYRMITGTGDGRDCGGPCAAKDLAAYAAAANAETGIHGSYFCPPDYADCAAKVNTFLSPFFDSPARAMVNAGSLVVHDGPMLAYSADGQYRYFHRTKDFGGSVAAFETSRATTLEAAASNYPSLIENGNVVVTGESRLDDGMKTAKGVRGGIGTDDRFVYLVIARGATVPDLADIMKSLGAKDALNLDGGGSAALWYGGKYVFGPGRLLPNAVLFAPR
ncbi:MAG: hypothetical protein RL272_577 [Candidatus Parcubacteria bacterium]